MASTRTDKPLLNRWVRAFPEFPRDVRRPAVFVLLFWTCWVATLVSHTFGLLDEDPAFGLVPVVLALVALATLWAMLPWSPRAGPRRMLLAPAFLAGTFVVGYLTDLNLSVVLYALVVANGVFLFGFRKGVAYAAATLPLFFTNVVLVDRVVNGPGRHRHRRALRRIHDRHMRGRGRGHGAPGASTDPARGTQVGQRRAEG